MTVIEIRPFRNGWKWFETPGVEPVFLIQEDARKHERVREVEVHCDARPPGVRYRARSRQQVALPNIVRFSAYD